jgi:phosphoribosylformylglycinamidine cyclo-ligase
MDGVSGARRQAYAAAGVDVRAGDRAVELMKAKVAATHGPEVLAGVGGFAAAVAPPDTFRQPVLVSATDGVGTKTAIAASLRRVGTIGHDVVAMCADDVVCLGARPLFFLDYLAVGRVEPDTVADLVGGVAEGCSLAGCALVGGETAEHPGLMEPDEFDLAGFCVGIVERAELLDGTSAVPGDVLVGIASSGLHANGYSLVRAILAEHQIPLGRPYLEVLGAALGGAAAERAAQEEPELVLATLGDVLLTPTRIYALDMLGLRAELAAAGWPLRGLAHITGGGLPGNVPRVLPGALAARLRPGAWPVPSVFRFVTVLGGLDGPELRATMNAGVGLVAVVPVGGVAPALSGLAGRGLRSWVIGDVVAAAGLTGQAAAERYVEVG